MSFGVKLAHSRFGLPPPGSGVFSTLPGRRDDPPVEAGHRDPVSRLDDDVLRLAVQLGIGGLEALHLLALFDGRTVIDEGPDRDALDELLQARQCDRRDSGC